LAPILDYTLDPSQPKTVGALAEAVSVEGSGTKFSSLCIITLVGLPEHHEKISQHLKNKMLPHLDLKNNKCVLGYVDNVQSYVALIQLMNYTDRYNNEILLKLSQ
jgi:hypothetical protein